MQVMVCPQPLPCTRHAGSCFVLRDLCFRFVLQVRAFPSTVGTFGTSSLLLRASSVAWILLVCAWVWVCICLFILGLVWVVMDVLVSICDWVGLSWTKRGGHIVVLGGTSARHLIHCNYHYYHVIVITNPSSHGHGPPCSHYHAVLCFAELLVVNSKSWAWSPMQSLSCRVMLQNRLVLIPSHGHGPLCSHFHAVLCCRIAWC